MAEEIISAADIDAAQFQEALERYPALIKDLTKSPKPGSLTLEELDYFRYVEAPTAFSIKGAKLSLKDLQKLVDWKLRHGTFRPTLPKLVASNSEDSVNSITEEGFSIYEKDHSELAAAVKKLSELKGIGPATASLLLAVYDPHKVIFFSDEVYKWLLPNADKPKYTPKEFDSLFAQSGPLMERLNVKAVDVEKVAYVLIKEAEPKVEPKPKPVPSGRPRGRPAMAESEKKPKPVPSGRPRGRPAKPESEKKQKAVPDAPARPRGRPAKPESEKVQKAVSDAPRPRGRPAKVTSSEAPATPKAEEPATKKRGRPAGPGKSSASKASAVTKAEVADDTPGRSSKRARLSGVA
ncbi:hypothetical protein BP6252_06894 [Coleophoma cylindrospora]|uniref:Uncharacterized protein n=1 Tax=Coleophoma cylindrospora TaxID=1849047 RepID=A0A3D8RG25_9HELO|nr:hypothetical protein BP6252_06894 [Coleophoma cylindrospora]